MQTIKCLRQGHQQESIISVCLQKECQSLRLVCRICKDQEIHKHLQNDFLSLDQVTVLFNQKMAKLNQTFQDLKQLKSNFEIIGQKIQHQIHTSITQLNGMMNILDNNRKNLNIINRVIAKELSSHMLGSVQLMEAWELKNDFNDFTIQFKKIMTKFQVLSQKQEGFSEIVTYKQQYYEEMILKREIMQLQYRFSEFISCPINKYQIDSKGKHMICQFGSASFRIFQITNSLFDEFTLDLPKDESVQTFTIDEHGDNLILGLSNGLLQLYTRDYGLKFILRKQHLFKDDLIKQIVIYKNYYITVRTQNRIICIFNTSNLDILFKQNYVLSGGFRIHNQLEFIGLPVLDGIQFIFYPNGLKQLFQNDIYIKKHQNILEFGKTVQKVLTYTMYDHKAQIYKYKFDNQIKVLEKLQTVILESQIMNFYWAFNDKIVIKITKRGYEFIFLMDNNEHEIIKKLNLQHSQKELKMKDDQDDQIHFIMDECQYVIEQYEDSVTIGQSKYLLPSS